jgi:hypothetical protein
MIISLLVALVIFGLVWWAATAILKAFGIGDPIATLVQVIIVIAAVLWLLQRFGLGGRLF